MYFRGPLKRVRHNPREAVLVNSYELMLQRTGRAEATTTQHSVDTLDPFAIASTTSQTFDGSKFFGGFGETKLHQVDYWPFRSPV